MNKRVLPFLGILITIGICIYEFQVFVDKPKDSTTEEVVNLPEILLPKRESSIYTEEDIEARLAYQTQMLIDPLTGKIPDDIHTKELKFSKNIPLRGSSRSSRQSALDWEFLGPDNFGGRARAISIDVTNEDILLSGSVSGGVFRSENGGQSWVRTTEVTSIQSVTAIVQDVTPGNENIWYYGTGELIGQTARGGGAPFRGDGIFRSEDGGRSWRQLEFTASGIESSFNDQFQYVWNMATSPLNTNEVYAAVFGGIARSVDGGETWDIVLGDTLNNFEEIVDLNEFNTPFYSDIQVSSNGIYYAALSTSTENVIDNTLILTGVGGIFRSEDGLNWERISVAPFPFANRRVVLGIDPQNEDRVYFLVTAINPENGSNTPQLWLYERDNFSPWTNLTQNIPDFGEPVGDFDLQGGYNMLVEVHPQISDLVFVGAANLYSSRTGFTQSDGQWIGGYDPINDISLYPGSHPDQHALAFFPSNPNRMIAAHDGGLSVTENNTADSIFWNFLNEDFVTTQYYTIGINAFEEDDVVLGGLQDNGTLLLPNTNIPGDWQRVLGGDGAYCDVSRGNLFYFLSFQNGQTFQINFNEEFGLAEFARVDPEGGSGYLFINPFIIEPLNNNIMFLPAGDVVWRNTNLSQIPRRVNQPTSVNWERLDDTQIFQEGQISAIDISQNPRGVVVYGSTLGALNRIDDALEPNVSVTDIRDEDFPENGFVTSISIDRRDANQILVAFSNYNIQSIFLSTDGGDDFVPVSGNLEEEEDGSGDGPSIRWVETIPLEFGGNLYLAGASSGLYSTQELNGMDTQWEKEGADNIGTSVVTMIQSRPIDGKVVIATHGNGVFSTNVPNTENVQVGETDSESGFQVFRPFPNPFQETSRIRYFIPEDGRVRVTIYDQTGREVTRLIDAFQFAGENEISWDGSLAGGFANQGFYIYRVEFQNFSEEGRLIFLGG